MNRKFFLVVTLVLLSSGCETTQGLRNAGPITTGERFREELAKVDAVCRERKIGPYLDPLDPEFRSKRALTNCDILRLKAFDLSAILATEEGKLAYSIKLPPPYDQPQVPYRPGMSSEDYFRHLCKVEAGDYVFRRVNGISRLVQLRRSPEAGRITLGSYSEEEPGGLLLAAYSKPEQYTVAPSLRMYNFLEVPYGSPQHSDDGIGLLFYGSKDVPHVFPTYGVAVRPLINSTAKFGYLWRGVERVKAREMGIIGGELLVIDVSTGEVLAFRREFVRYSVGNSAMGSPWFRGQGCGLRTMNGFAFISQVLIPARKEVQ